MFLYFFRRNWRFEYKQNSRSGRKPSGRYLPEGFLPLREFCLYSKRQFLRKKYKNIRFCYVKSLYFRYTSKIKKFRTKNPDFGTFLYGIRCFGAFYTKLSIYRSQVQICVYIHLPAMLVRLCCLYLQEI